MMILIITGLIRPSAHAQYWMWVGLVTVFVWKWQKRK